MGSTVARECRTILLYQLSLPRRWPHKGKDIRLVWNIEGLFPDFSGFVLVANQERVPRSLTDGVELFQWRLEPGQWESEHETWVSLVPIQQRRWTHFSCKAMVLDPVQGNDVLIIHPNTCRTISAMGKVQCNKRRSPKRRYRPGVPRMVICPHCFEEFPVEQMQFVLGDGETMSTRYTWLHRLLHWPLTVPKDSQGRRLIRKLCPHNDNHILPFAAGDQRNLIIGLIGGVYAGKCTYLVSLVKQLRDRVTGDLQAALRSATEETDEDRKRAITLEFHHTAPEVFSEWEMVRRKVGYLKVASGIMFLIDPLQVPAVRELLPSWAQPPIFSEVSPRQIIANVLTELSNWKAKDADQKLSIPVAVVLTKCDVLRDAGLIEANRLWNTGKRHIGYFDNEAHEDMSSMWGNSCNASTQCCIGTFSSFSLFMPFLAFRPLAALLRRVGTNISHPGE